MEARVVGKTRTPTRLARTDSKREARDLGNASVASGGALRDCREGY